MSRAKYRPGEKVGGMAELAFMMETARAHDYRGAIVFWNDKPQAMAWLQNITYISLARAVHGGIIRRVVRREERQHGKR